MTPETPVQKKLLREQLRVRLKAISPEQRQEASARAARLLEEQDIWATARSILFYAPTASEIDLAPLLHDALRQKKTVALPRFVPEEKAYAAFQISNFQSDCLPGKFGIIEPGEKCPLRPLNQLDLVLVPGVGFSRAGHRLGRGQGFYDRLLARVSGIKCGVAFDEQLLNEIPAETHDVRMNFILTPTLWLRITS